MVCSVYLSIYIFFNIIVLIQADAPVREWDLHKLNQSDPDDRDRRHGNNQYDDRKEFEERRVRKRSHSPSPGKKNKGKSIFVLFFFIDCELL